eukprot:scaffold179932_cov32-Tisochrysis_lutea.AAC.2
MEYLSERVKWCGLHHSTGQHWRESRLGWGSPPIRPQVEKTLNIQPSRLETQQVKAQDVKSSRLAAAYYEN